MDWNVAANKEIRRGSPKTLLKIVKCQLPTLLVGYDFTVENRVAG